MRHEDPRLLELARAILEGVSPDWDALEHAASDEDACRTIQRLRILWEIMAVHRRDHPLGGKGTKATALDSSQRELVDLASEAQTPVDHDRAMAASEPPNDQNFANTASLSRQPTTIGSFRIVRKLGQGGMGIVYEADQQHPRRTVALKVVRGGSYVDETHVRMFRREIQTLARLQHPGIAAIYESGCTDDGQHFFAMELVRGESLADYCKRRSIDGTLSPAEVKHRLQLFRKICDAISYAHQRGVIHRDLKPANISVLPELAFSSSVSDLKVPDIKILDFGLARITESDVAMSTILTDLGSVRGTLPYMSPEQVRANPDEVDVRTDVYSLGVLLYEMLTGTLPFDVSRGLLAEAFRAICEDPPKLLGKTWKGTRRVDPDLVTILHKAIEKDPARRYQSVAGLAEDVQRYLTEQPILARPPNAAYQLRKLVARHKVPFTFAAALLALLVVFAVSMSLQAARIARERDMASQERDRANREGEVAQQVSNFLVDLFRISDPMHTGGNTITAREILDNGSERIANELQDQPLIQARLMRTMGEVYRSLGLNDRAQLLLEQAVLVLRDSVGEEGLELASCLASLGAFYSWYGQSAKALPLFKRGLAIQERLLPSDDPKVGSSLLGLGSFFAATGEYDSARSHYEKAVAIFEKGENREAQKNLAWCMNNLGLITFAEFDYARASSYHRQALEIKERTLPPDHPDVAISLDNLGYVIGRMGDYDQARSMLERALRIREATFGPEHPQTVETLENLGETWWRTGNPSRAQPLLERALAIEEEWAGGPDMVILYVLAAVLRDNGRYEEAEVLFKRALSLHNDAAAAGKSFISAASIDLLIRLDSPDFAECLREYAALLRKTAREREAVKMEAQAREILVHWKGQYH